jgi:hypothetical protein
MRKSKQEKKENNYNQPKSNAKKRDVEIKIKKRGIVNTPKDTNSMR